MSSSLCYVAVLLLGALCSVGSQELSYQGQGWWLQQPYTADDQFSERVEYGNDIVLKCGENFTSMEYWVIPDMTIIDSSNPSVEYLSFDGTSKTEWLGDGRSLNITLLVENQFGFYFCHGMDGGERKVVKHAINYNGPYFGDLWEMYRMNTIVGCSAAAAFVVIAIVSYCCYEWRCSDDDHYEDDTLKIERAHSSSYQNRAYNGGSGDVVKSQPGATNVMVEDSTML